jgi:hypothetical protein
VGESSAPVATETPEVAVISKPVRFMTVSAFRTNCLRIQGNWLEDAGFSVGTRVQILVTPNRLVVEPVPTVGPSPLPGKPQKRERPSWVHNYPNHKPPSFDFPIKSG